MGKINCLKKNLNVKNTNMKQGKNHALLSASIINPEQEI